MFILLRPESTRDYGSTPPKAMADGARDEFDK